MHDDGDDNIFDKDDTLDFIIYKKFEEQRQERKVGKSGCFGIVTLLLLPAICVMCLN